MVEIQIESYDSAISIKFSRWVILMGSGKDSSEAGCEVLIFQAILGVAFSPNLPSRVAWVLEDSLSFLRLCLVLVASKLIRLPSSQEIAEHPSDEVLPC